MENLEMLVVEENGQLAIDFDSLELLTSAEFVNSIYDVIKVSKVKNVNIYDTDNFVVVTVLTGVFVYQFSYHKTTNKVFPYQSILKADIEQLGGKFNV